MNPDKNRRQPAWFWPVICGLAVMVVLGMALVLTKPSMTEVSAHIDAVLIEEAKSNYNQTEHDFLFFNVARGKNVRTADTDAYLGLAGQVIPLNHGFSAVIGDILFWLPSLVGGARVTITLTITSVSVGLLLSVFLALGTISKLKTLNRLCSAYIFFFRGTPLLMQLFFVYYGLPIISPALTINNKFLAAFIAFTLNSAAYCSEIIRAAIQSIDKGQFEVSHALGLSYAQTMRLVIIPQSIRRLIPPVANEFIMVLKDASLVSIIALTDLTYSTRQIMSSSNTVLVFIPAMIIYLIITAFFTFVFNRMEKRFSLYH